MSFHSLNSDGVARPTPTVPSEADGISHDRMLISEQYLLLA